MHDFPLRITGKRIILRKISLDDANAWKSFNNAIKKRMQEWSEVPSVVYARNEILHYLRMWKKGTRFVYVIIDKKSGKIIGDFHLKSLKEKRIEFGHALHPKTWGTGITYETLDAVKKVAKKKGLALWCKVEDSNIRSWRSLEKYGATFIGTRPMIINGKKEKMKIYEL